MTDFNYKKYSLENLENWMHDRPFTVIADGGACITYCASLKGAIRSAKNFSPDFKSLVIRHNFDVVKVVR